MQTPEDTANTPDTKTLIARLERIIRLIEDARYEISGSGKKPHINKLLEEAGEGFQSRLAMTNVWQALLSASDTVDRVIATTKQT